MEDALARGDHQAARRMALVLSRSEDPRLRDPGLALARRLERDPVVLGVLLSTGFILAAVALHYLGHR